MAKRKTTTLGLPKISEGKSSNALTIAGRDASGSLIFTFLRARGDVTYIIQDSTNLQSWTDLNTNPGIAGQNAVYTDFVTNAPRHFLRLKVAQP